jgi:hypothetical protein
MFASLVVLVGAARSLPPISNSSNLCFCAVAAAVAIAQDATTIDAAVTCQDTLKMGQVQCLTTNVKCSATAIGADKICWCFVVTFQCLAALTPCTSTTPEQTKLKLDACVKNSMCSEERCEALVAGVDIMEQEKNYDFLVPIAILCGWAVLFCIAFAVKLCQRQRAARAQAAATQVAVIAGLGVVGKPSAPALTPEPEFLKELEVLNKVNNR